MWMTIRGSLNIRINATRIVYLGNSMGYQHRFQCSGVISIQGPLRQGVTLHRNGHFSVTAAGQNINNAQEIRIRWSGNNNGVCEVFVN